VIGARPALLLAGAAALLAATPCAAVTWPSPQVDQAAGNPAMQLLQSAAWSSVARPWTAVQRVVTVHSGLPRLSAMRVAHMPGRGTDVRLLTADQRALARDAQDAALLGVLAGHYEVTMAGSQRYDGRVTTVLEARRPDVSGAGAVAGRFWIDNRTGMVLRRDVLDERGAVVRTTSFGSLNVGAPRTVPPTPSRVIDEQWLDAMRAQGWPVRSSLPGGLDLFDARLHDVVDDGVLQLSYSDGLSTVSLFVQSGELPEEPAGTPRPLDGGGTVWVTGGSPERLVWSGDGRTWTMLSDAPDSVVAAALGALPHTPSRSGDSAPRRVWRGMAVVGGWLNPFR
jgi:sigma-E factor negative regulatory protein RseB